MVVIQSASELVGGLVVLTVQSPFGECSIYEDLKLFSLRPRAVVSFIAR